MTVPRHDCTDDTTAATSPYRIFRDGRPIASVWSTTQAVVNPPIATQSLETSLQEVNTPPPGRTVRTCLMP